MKINSLSSDEDATASERRLRGRAINDGLAEVVVSFTVALAFVLSCRSIDVNPVERVGQVAGLAAVQVRAAVFAAPIILVAALSTRYGGRGLRLVIAAAAGLLTSIAAGGIVVALHNTPWGLFALFGDAGRLAQWSQSLITSDAVMAPHYPPLYLWLVATYARVTGTSTGFALKDIGILFTAITGPCAFVAWRMVLRPLSALLVAFVSCSVFLDPYKPYSTLSLIVLPAIFSRIIVLASSLIGRNRTLVPLEGLVLGILLGGLFILYPGWFVWSAPGAALAIAFLSNWRGDIRLLTTFGITLGAGFLVVAGRYMVDLFGAAKQLDTYFYFDVYVEPAYIAMFRGDLPGVVGPWPPPGEFGGVGVFTLGLFAAVGFALWIGRKNVIIVTAVLMAASAWILRMYLASRMYESGAVQLYPRTTSSILLSLLLAATVGAVLIGQRLVQLGRAYDPLGASGAPHLGVLVFVLGIATSVASATADRYMPKNENSVGILAYYAHITPLPDGDCPRYAPGSSCRDFVPPK